MAELDFDAFDALTFDCYGTLIDWETGILGAMRTALDGAAGQTSDEQLLEVYATAEAATEAGPYRRYREVLGESLRRVCAGLGVEPSPAAVDAFGGSVQDWPAFPDAAAALARLATRFRLGVITNCDDDLFAYSNARLGEPFTWVITAQQLGSYKPDERNFLLAFERIDVPRERILHVAQSLFHDHVPARRLGMETVWVNRRGGTDRLGRHPTGERDTDPDRARHGHPRRARPRLTGTRRLSRRWSEPPPRSCRR